MQLSFKTWVARALETGGMLAFAEHLLRSRRKAVFALHRVLPEEEMSECYNLHLAISPDSLDHFLTWLRSRCAIVSFDELIDDSLPGSPAACAITFDDGWEDNHRVALPILQSHGVSALIYLVTGLIGKSDLFPEERLWRILRSAGPQERTAIADLLPRADGSAGLVAAFKELPHARKLALLQELQPQGSKPAVKFMDWTQVAALVKAGYTAGSHTAHHTILPLEDDATITHQLAASKQELDVRLAQNTVHFAFPSGRFDERTLTAVRAAGYRTAVTTANGAVRPGSDPFRIPRLVIDNTVVNDTHNAFSPARARFSQVRSMIGRGTQAADYMLLAEPVPEPARLPKILLVIDEMEAVTAGGTERQVLQIARLLATAGLDVQIAVLRRTQWLGNTNAPCKIKRFEIDKMKSPKGLVQLMALDRWLRSERFDVVQSFFVEANFVVPIMARLAGVPVILGSRRNLNYWMNPFWCRLQRISNRFATRLVANCEAVKRVVQETEKVPSPKVDVMYNGLDVARFAPNAALRSQAREKYGYSDTDVVIGAVSVLRPIKGCETFIDAAKEVVRKAPSARFVLVGDGPLRLALEAHASDLGDKFLFAGVQQDIRPFLNMFDIGVLSSESEGFSNSILEYMAAGLPSVVSDVGGNPEAIENAGLVVPPRQPMELASALLKLLHDPAQRALFSRRAIIRSQDFSLESTQRKLVDYYDRLLRRA